MHCNIYIYELQYRYATLLGGRFAEIINKSIIIEINIGTPCYSVNVSVVIYTDINNRIIKYTILVAWGLIHASIKLEISKDIIITSLYYK